MTQGHILSQLYFRIGVVAIFLIEALHFSLHSFFQSVSESVSSRYFLVLLELLMSDHMNLVALRTLEC